MSGVKARVRCFTRVVVGTNRDWEDALGLYLGLGFAEYACDEEGRYLNLVLYSLVASVA